MRFLELVQNIEAAPAPVAFNRVSRIRQGLQFAEDKPRDDQGPAQEPGRDEIADAPVDDDIRVDYKRLVPRRLPGETHIWNDEGELASVAPPCQHHPEIAERAIDHDPRRPLYGVALVTQNIGSREEVREKQ